MPGIVIQAHSAGSRPLLVGMSVRSQACKLTKWIEEISCTAYALAGRDLVTSIDLPSGLVGLSAVLNQGRTSGELHPQQDGYLPWRPQADELVQEQTKQGAVEGRRP
jgi:hypothetical protein